MLSIMVYSLLWVLRLLVVNCVGLICCSLLVSLLSFSVLVSCWVGLMVKMVVWVLRLVVCMVMVVVVVVLLMLLVLVVMINCVLVNLGLNGVFMSLFEW